jgi:hypothetical protein
VIPPEHGQEWGTSRGWKVRVACSRVRSPDTSSLCSADGRHCSSEAPLHLHKGDVRGLARFVKLSSRGRSNRDRGRGCLGPERIR